MKTEIKGISGYAKLNKAPSQKQMIFLHRQPTDEPDYVVHMDYLHYNPVKFGHVEQVKDWPYSSFHHLVKRQVYPESRGGNLVELEVGESF